MHIVPLSIKYKFFNVKLEEWFSLNINHSLKAEAGWSVFWAMACHSICFWQNREDHNEEFVRPFNPTLHMHGRLKEYEDALVLNKKVVRRNKKIMLIKWIPTKLGMVKFYVDGACIKGVATGCGGIVKDDKDYWLGGFAKSVNMCSSYMAEL
ncbi:unnamed protein product [Lathyrus sativus]|nr:unnamed protein product [Lathyrus sativus]